MVSKLITQTAVWIAAMAAVLFVAAGTVRWPAAWVFLAEMAGLGLAIGGQRTVPAATNKTAAIAAIHTAV